MRRQNKVVSALVAVVCCMLTFGLSVGLFGCGKNDETVIRETISQALDPFKSPTRESLEPIITKSGTDLSEIEEYGIDPYEFMTHCLSHFDYTIDSVTVDGESATASLTLKSADISVAVKAVQAEMTENAADYADILSSEDALREFMKTFFDKVYEKLDASEELVESQAQLNLTKTDGEWGVDDDGVNTIVSGMFGGIEI
ncbi:MAG: hypothetical protein J6D34_11080 [Atopobiaceae bacterium]|nr:hypothetical protein [Atopobiaceae bacterium]